MGLFYLQNENTGLNAVGFELSNIRAKYGEDNLGVIIYNNDEEIRNENDIFFSSHVIKHILDLKQYFTLIKEKITEDGILIAFYRNGSEEFQIRNS